jgi:hypothetical protein
MELKKLINTLNPDQRFGFSEMRTSNRLQLCYPTGVGKGYLMGVDLKQRLLEEGEKLVVVGSHRLILNIQHMDDALNVLSESINDVRFIFNGSTSYDRRKLHENKDLQRNLKKYGLSSNEVLIGTQTKKDLENKVKELHLAGKKVVIITTYHSLNKLAELPIETFYCDEAHTLASNELETEFQTNYDSLKCLRNGGGNVFFFTATPKDCGKDTDLFLMNNEETFGKRIGLTIDDSRHKGYITRLVLHLAAPGKYLNDNLETADNKVSFILDCYKEHSFHVKSKSISPRRINAKMLVKCQDVDNMWQHFQLLLERLLKDDTLRDIKIFAGASRGKEKKSNPLYRINGIKVDKSHYLTELKRLKNTDKAIVLHVDTLSEGVNIKGFTGVMFLTENTPTIIKILQNIGRATRVLDADRKKLLECGINTDDYIGWLKPNAYIILPIYSPKSKASQENIANTITKLRDCMELDSYIVSIGDDKARGNGEDEKYTHELKLKTKKLHNGIEHFIEKMTGDKKDIEETERLDKLSRIQLVMEYRAKNNVR